MSVIQRCSVLHLRLANKLSPYLREKVVKRMMVHVADTVEKGVKSVMFPTRDTAMVTVSNCCGHFRCEGTFGVLWDRKDPNCASVCLLLVCLPLFHVGVPHNIDPSSAAPERKLLGRRRRIFQMLLTCFWTCNCDGLP